MKVTEPAKEQTCVVFSYIPFVDLSEINQYMGKLNESTADKDKLTATIEKSIMDAQDKMPLSRGVLWCNDNESNTTAAMIIVEHSAKELQEHMLTWADGKASRFSWFIEREHKKWTTPSKYSLGIIADPQQSIDRFKIAHEIFNAGPELQDDNNYKVYSIPIISTQETDTSVIELNQALNKNLYTDVNRLSVGFVNIEDILDEDGQLDHNKFNDMVNTYEWMVLDKIPNVKLNEE
jgi:hypothetical protein